jgi:hypothetical protein
MKALMSARSTKAASIELARFVVHKVSTLGKRFSLSNCVKIAFTTRTASEGSEPLAADDLADVSDSTSSMRRQTMHDSSSTSS